MNVTETNLGFLIETPNVLVHFGGVKSNLANLKASFPAFSFIRVKQTHSDLVVESVNPELDYQIEADAHFTRTANTAVCISTADCVPAMIYDYKNELVAGVHAGWRGVANRILPKTIERLVKEGSRPQDLQVFVGPHIQRKSFEVDLPVQNQLLASIGLTAIDDGADFITPLSKEKSLVDLNMIVRQQFRNSGIEPENLFDLHIDTFSDVRFHSHRRDRERAGRQLSFICRK